LAVNLKINYEKKKSTRDVHINPTKYFIASVKFSTFEIIKAGDLLS